MFGSRLLQFYFLMPLKNDKKEFIKVDNKVWTIFGVIELIGLCITATFSSYRGTTAATSIVEVLVFIGQYLYTSLNLSIQERRTGTKHSEE